MSNPDSPTLTLLHISDLHFGQHIAAPSSKATAHFDQKLVTRELLEDVTKLSNSGMKPDWILVTGDIAFSGQVSEYTLARAWLEQLTKALDLGLDRVLLVPGNHDGDRKKALGNIAATATHEALRRAPLQLTDLLSPENAAQLQTTLWPKLAAYADFAGDFGAPRLTPSSPFWTLRLETVFAQPVYAIGLNSCLLSYDGEDAPSNLALGLGQLERAFRDIPPGALVLAMAHHSPEWLVDGVAGQHKDVGAAHALTTFLQKHPHILFVGHVHRQGGLVTHPLHTGGLLRFVAGAGHEAAHEGGRHAYAWVRIHGGGIDFYPRMWNADCQCFQPEANRFTLERGQEYVRIRRVKLADPLEKWLELPGPPTSSTTPPSPPPSIDPLSLELWQPHLTYTLKKHSHIELLGIRRRGGAVRIPLEQVYVELSADRADRGNDWHRAPSARGKGGDPARHSMLESPHRTLKLHQALARSPRAAIIGDPGSGKTTLLRHVAQVVADGLQHLGEAATKARALLGLTPDQPLPFPVFTTVARLDAFLEVRELSNKKVRPAHALGFVLEELKEWSGVDLGHLDALKSVVSADRLLLLLDGLDEVPGHAARRRVATAVSELLAGTPQLRLVLTSRTRAFEPELAASLGVLDPYRLHDMSEEEIRRFLTLWHKAVWEEDVARGEQDAEALFQELRGHQEVRRMANNPNILTLIAILKHTQTRLPERRVELYREVVDLFLDLKDVARDMEDPWEQALGFRVDLSEKRLLASVLALKMHTGGDAGRTVPVKVPVMCFAQQLLESGRATTEAQALGLGEKLLDVLELRSGLLRREGYGVQFSHLGYQEFLAALALSRERKDDVLWNRLEPHVRDDWWNEVLRLLVAIQEDQSGPLLLNLANAGQGSAPDWQQAGRGIALALGGLNDLPPLHVTKGVEAAVMGKLELLVGKKTKVPIKDRVEALVALGRVGDPRLGLEKPENWIWIPPGEFKMGDDESEHDFEKPAHEVTFAQGFYLSRFPVTNHDFNEFVEAGGYSEQGWWSEEGWAYCQQWKLEAPGYWTYSRWSAPNQPVVGVSWHEADAFCRWMTAQVRSATPAKTAPSTFRLPSEAEWEYAARGKVGRPYPWGAEKPTPERANFDETGLGQTSPVGAFPLGTTLEGLLDLAGNVWEWVEDLYASNYEGAPSNGRPRTKSPHSTRVVRGGGWSIDGGRLRAAIRDRWDVGRRDIHVGFRVVRVPAASNAP